mgnify:CR=1 FL=1
MATRKMAKKSMPVAEKKAPMAKSRIQGTIDRSLARDIEFSFYAPLAQKVTVAGSFNKWDMTGSALRKSKDGNWKGTVKLKPGRYEYRFLIDGRWENDQKSVPCVMNDQGTYNCIIEVK